MLSWRLHFKWLTLCDILSLLFLHFIWLAPCRKSFLLFLNHMKIAPTLHSRLADWLHHNVMCYFRSGTNYTLILQNVALLILHWRGCFQITWWSDFWEPFSCWSYITCCLCLGKPFYCCVCLTWIFLCKILYLLFFIAYGLYQSRSTLLAPDRFLLLQFLLYIHLTHCHFFAVFTLFVFYRM